MKLITDDKAARLVRALTVRYLDTCDEQRVNRGTAAKLLGMSRTRLGQLEKAVRSDDDAMVNLGVFLRLKQLLQDGYPAAEEAGVLPAPSNRGNAQTAILEFFGLGAGSDGE